MIELQVTRDLIGRLLNLGTVEDIDLEKMFKYPQTDQSKLLHTMESMIVEHDGLPHI